MIVPPRRLTIGHNGGIFLNTLARSPLVERAYASDLNIRAALSRTQLVIVNDPTLLFRFEKEMKN